MVSYGGWVYSTLANVNPNSYTRSGCEAYSWYRIKSHWSLAPNGGALQAVVNAHPWNTDVILGSSGWGYGTSDYFGRPGGSRVWGRGGNYLQRSGGNYKSGGCYIRIGIRCNPAVGREKANKKAAERRNKSRERSNKSHERSSKHREKSNKAKARSHKAELNRKEKVAKHGRKIKAAEK